jgi:hypothetical protein
MFIDYMLKFETKEEAETVLMEIGLLQEVEGVVMPAFGSNVDIIGTIWKPDGTSTTTEEGFSLPNMVALDGYHINVRAASEIQALDPYKVTPATPYRVWA